MKSIPIGHLNRRIDVQKRVETETDLGEMDVTWQTLRSVSASISPLRGKQVLEAGALEARLTHRIIIRYFRGLTPRHRLVYDGRVFEIHSAANMFERNRYHDIMAEEMVGVTP